MGWPEMDTLVSNGEFNGLGVNLWNIDHILGWNLGKVCQRGLLDFFMENIHKLSHNILNSWIFFILMINKKKFFDFIE
jgi:hypothetical protein